MIIANPLPTFKRCPRCRVDKPLTTHNFRYRADPNKRHIFRSVCNRCMAIRRTEQNQLKGAKNCSQCKIMKPRSEFHRRQASIDGRQSSCRACDALRAAPPPKKEPVSRVTESAAICPECCNITDRRPRLGLCRCGLPWEAEPKPELMLRRYYDVMDRAG
jgi:hypothetical protein